jgi:hypothetical protein
LVDIARLAGVRQPHGAACHRIFHAAHDELGAQLAGTQVAKRRHFREVVAGVDHQERIGNAAHAKGFFGTPEHHQRILAAGEQEGGALKGGGHFAQEVDGLFFQRVEVAVAELAEQLGFCAGGHAGVSSLCFWG